MPIESSAIGGMGPLVTARGVKPPTARSLTSTDVAKNGTASMRAASKFRLFRWRQPMTGSDSGKLQTRARLPRQPIVALSSSIFRT